MDELARRHTLDFTRRTYGKKRHRGRMVDAYKVNFHHEVLASHLDEFHTKRGKKLMVFMPPRHGKTELCTRRFPAWLLGNNPDEHIIFTTYSGTKAKRENIRVQRIIQSPTYRRLFPGIELSKGQPGEMRSATDGFTIPGHRGQFLSAGVGGGITGEGATTIIIDDPVKSREEAESPTIREKIWSWFTDDLMSRADTEDVNVLLVMTRWHEDDLAGRILNDPVWSEGWEVIEFQATREINYKQETDDNGETRWAVDQDGKLIEIPGPYDHMIPDNAIDPRKEGEALWPWKYSERFFKKFKSNFRTWRSLYQQRPTVEEGNEFKTSYFPLYDLEALLTRAKEAGVSLRPRFVWDTAQSPDKEGCPSVIIAYYAFENEVYVIDVFRDWLGIDKLLPAARTFFRRNNYRDDCRILVEPKMNGPDIIKLLRREGFNIYALEMPKGDKVVRARGVLDIVIARKVHLLRGSAWLDNYLGELKEFPHGKFWDQIDTTVYMIHDAIITGTQGAAETMTLKDYLNQFGSDGDDDEWDEWDDEEY